MSHPTFSASPLKAIDSISRIDFQNLCVATRSVDMALKVDGLKYQSEVIESVVRILSDYQAEILTRSGTLKIIHITEIEVMRNEENLSDSDDEGKQRNRDGFGYKDKILSMMIEQQNLEIVSEDFALVKEIISKIH